MFVVGIVDLAPGVTVWGCVGSGLLCSGGFWIDLDLGEFLGDLCDCFLALHCLPVRGCVLELEPLLGVWFLKPSLEDASFGLVSACLGWFPGACWAAGVASKDGLVPLVNPNLARGLFMLNWVLTWLRKVIGVGLLQQCPRDSCEKSDWDCEPICAGGCV